MTITGRDERTASLLRRARELEAAAAGPGNAQGQVARRTAGTVARAADCIPGAELLDLLRDRWFGRYARFPSPAALDTVTLWAAHAHMRDATGVLVFSATPRLYLLSSEPGSGKSKVLKLLGMVVPACYGLDLEPTAAGLAHSINRERATVLIDEGDILFAAGARKASVRAIINGGYTRHGTVLNGRGGKATRVPVFGALALAGLDTLEKATGDLLAALLSRGIKIRMRPAPSDDQPAKVTRETELQGTSARKWLADWAAQVRGQVASAQPDMPEGLAGRPEQIWEPLLAVAEAAGGTWPARAYAACSELAMAIPAPPVDEDDPDQAEQFATFAASFGQEGGEDE